MEIFDVVDENGVPTGEKVEREKAHSLGIRHRTSHVWVYRKRSGKVQLLLQKRSADKDSYPGCYDISSAGHIPAGYGFIESALRELSEELGIKAEASELIFCGRRNYTFHEVFYGREFRDNQVSSVYALRRDAEAEAFAVQKSEIESVLWMELDACAEMVKNNSAPNCIISEELDMVSEAVNKMD